MPVRGKVVRNTRYKKSPRPPRSAHVRYYYSRSLVLDSPKLPTSSSRCQSLPRSMDSHSRSASPREAARPQHRPPSPPTPPTAFDNNGYQNDESDPNHNDSFTSNGPHHNGHSKEPNGDTKTPEAVNLELINLTPKNGNKKKDVEVEMNTSNPYDEYFVPVNEHRKYMRGEKLYVTADKRGEKGGCKRPLCWTLVALVVAAIVALIVLAATGILFGNSPTPLEQYNSSLSSARAFGGLGHAHDLGHDHDHDHHDHGHEYSQEQNDEDVSPLSKENGDFAMYVPRTLEGELKIDNEEFTAALKDPESDEYREFAANFASALKRALFDRNTLASGESEINIEVVKVRKGSLIVTYRIHWKPKTSSGSYDDPLTTNSLKLYLDQYLEKNSRMISVYHIAEDSMSIRNVLDLCQINKFDCEHECVFDERTLDFTCICPRGQIIDMENTKKCMYIFENPQQAQNKTNEDTKQKEYRVLDLGDGISSTKSVPGHEKTDTQHDKPDDSFFDWKETRHITPEQTTTESDPDLKFSHIFGSPDQEKRDEHLTTTTESVPTAEPQPEPEPSSSEPNVSAETEPKSKPTMESKTEPTSEPEPAAEAKPEPDPTSEPEPAAEPKPESEQTSGPEPTAEPKPEPEPTSEPEPAAEPKVTLEPEPSAEPKPTSKPELRVEPTAEPEPKAEHTPAPEQVPTAAPEPEPTESDLVGEPKTEPEPTESDLVAEPKTDPTKPGPEPILQQESKQSLNPKPAVELKPQPGAEPEPTSEPQSISETTSQTESRLDVEPLIRPTTEASAEKHSTDGFISLNQTDIFAVESKPKEPRSRETETPNSFETQNMAKVFSKVKLEMSNTTPYGNSQSEMKPNKDNTQTNDEIETVTTKQDYQMEPSYMDKPSQPSLEHKESQSNNLSDPKYILNNISETTTQSDWLQDAYQRNNKANISHYNDTNIQSYLNFIKENNGDKPHETTESTTTRVNVSSADEDVLLTLLTNNNAELENKTSQYPIFTDFKQEENISKSPPEVITTTEDIKGYNSAMASNAEITTILEKVKQLTPDSTEQVESTTVSELQTNGDIDYKQTAKHDINRNSSQHTTESAGVDEITFDTINNMLYNRSSKSINNEMTDNIPTEMIESINTATTDSDWISEPITEINYVNTIKDKLTTDPTTTKLEELINGGISKDDFEPDYLNNMGSTKVPSHDHPVYGMIHDYDNEDSRVKRVNSEAREITVTGIPTKSESKETNTKLISEDETTVMVPEYDEKDEIKATGHVATTTPSAPVAPTTVSQYIYKAKEKVVLESTSTLIKNNSDLTSIKSTSVINSEPSLMGENSDFEKSLLPRQLPIGLKEGNTTNQSIANETEKVNVDVTTSDISIQNGNITQSNNLNVTIYEKPHNYFTNSSKSTHSHSGEYEDHEKETNPFLPEVENNISLVKKLQEGHDLEPTNLNETQNENAEEHNISSETHVTLTSDESSTVNELMNENSSTNQESETNRHENKNADEEDTRHTDKSDVQISSPISRFLMDTDDLDINNKPGSTTESLENVQTTPKAANADEYLSVVPIKEERLEERESVKKNYKSENLQDLNDISDSPKKSDRRTFDASKVNSVINNEA